MIRITDKCDGVIYLETVDVMDTHTLILLWLTLLLIQLSFSSPPSRRVWECTGPQSKYSYLDCERDYSYSSGCYYVEHFSQFRPCAWICNDIEFSSIDEERCRAFCPSFFMKSCALKTLTIESTSISATPQQISAERIPFKSAPEVVKVPEKNQNSSWMLVLIIVASATAVAGVVGLVIVGMRKLKHGRLTRKSVASLPLNSPYVKVDKSQITLQTPVQPEDFFEEYQKSMFTENAVNHKKEIN